MAVEHNDLARAFHQYLSEEEIDEVARATGFLQRKRKATPLRFVCAIVLGLASEHTRTLAGLRRFFTSICKVTITSAAFQKRFTNAAAEMMERLFDRLLEKALKLELKSLPARYRRFKDVIAVDSTVFALRDKLAKHFRGFKSKGTKAMARITTTMSLRSYQVRDLRITGGRTSETRGFKITRSLAGQLVVMDLGFFSFKRFRALKRVRAFFISRLKDAVNPVVLAVHLGKTNVKQASGRKFLSLRFKELFVDLDVRFGEGSQAFEARVVGVWNRTTKEYHWYVTNVSRDLFGPADIAEMYRLRWQVELLYKEWKSLFRLDEIPSGKKATARCLIFASLIAHLLGRMLAQLLLKKRPWQYSPRKWSQYLLHFTRCIAKAICDADLGALQRILQEIKRTAPSEIMRENPYVRGIYGVSGP
jgi:putative transposase